MSISGWNSDQFSLFLLSQWYFKSSWRILLLLHAMARMQVILDRVRQFTHINIPIFMSFMIRDWKVHLLLSCCSILLLWYSFTPDLSYSWKVRSRGVKGRLGQSKESQQMWLFLTLDLPGRDVSQELSQYLILWPRHTEHLPPAWHVDALLVL